MQRAAGRSIGTWSGVMHPLDVHVFTPEEFEADAREAHLYHWTAETALQVPALRVAGNELRTQGQLSGKATMQASGVLSS